MKILSIGMDKDLLKKGSVSFRRHQMYAREAEELHAVVFARKAYGSTPVRISENAWAHPTNASTTLELFYHAFSIGKRILTQEGEWVLSAQDPFESGLVAYVLSKITGVPFLIQEHGDFFSQSYWRKESLANQFRFWVGCFLIRQADHVRVVSQRIANALQHRGIPSERITVVPVHTDTQAFREAKKDANTKSLVASGDEVLILTMGRFVPQKNLTLLIRAFIKILSKGAKAKLLILGKGAEETKLRTCALEAPEGSVVFQAWTDNAPQVFKGADVYALSSNYEGWGRVCIEALAAGVPLLMTDVGCAGEVVLDGVNGLVVPVEDEWAFAEGLYKLTTDAALRERLAQGGMKTVEALPTFEEDVTLYIQSLELCLKTKKH